MNDDETVPPGFFEDLATRISLDDVYRDVYGDCYEAFGPPEISKTTQRSEQDDGL